MDIKEIKQLVRLMVENDLSELDMEEGQTRVHLKRGPGAAPAGVAPAPALPVAPAAAPAAEGAPAKAEEVLLEIRSPMVGTFYAAASPDSDPYVQAGQAVHEDTVVGIIEAMKVMNEIKAECSGTIVEACAKNAQPVEYGQVLFRVRPG